MADEEVKNEEIPQATPEAVAEVPAEAKQEELPLVAEEVKEEIVEEKVEEPKVEEPKPDWKDKELKSKHRQLQEAKRRETELQRRAEVAEALAAKFNQTVDKTTDFAPAVVPADQVEKRAQELNAQQRYVDECNKIAKDGETKYKTDWKDVVSNLEMLGGFDQDTMNGILASDDPSRAIYELGKNPDQYHRIMELPVPRRIIEIGKIAMQTTVKKVSDAPPPVNPVGGRAAPAATTLDDKMDDDKWFQTRRAQRRAKWEAQQPRR
jgi:hypothetical protein